MNCAWKELIALLPQNYKQAVDNHGKDSLQELRLRLGRPPELVCGGKSHWLDGSVTREELEHVVNLASCYSPWSADTAADGYITAPGGHRVGLCGVAMENGLRELTSLNIRVARDLPGVSAGLPQRGNLLIIGPPGCGKTTLLRDYSRSLAENKLVSVVDQRGELFPPAFSRGRRMDVLTGKEKPQGIEMVLRTMGPDVIAVDEITCDRDCRSLLSAGWCGVTVAATAHAADKRDLMNRQIYRPLVELGLFENVVVMGRDKSYRLERMTQ